MRKSKLRSHTARSTPKYLTNEPNIILKLYAEDGVRYDGCDRDRDTRKVSSSEVSAW